MIKMQPNPVLITCTSPLTAITFCQNFKTSIFERGKVKYTSDNLWPKLYGLYLIIIPNEREFHELQVVHVVENYVSWSKGASRSSLSLGVRPLKNWKGGSSSETKAHLGTTFPLSPCTWYSGELLWRFCRLPLLELKFSNIDIAAVRRLGLSQSVAAFTVFVTALTGLHELGLCLPKLHLHTLDLHLKCSRNEAAEMLSEAQCHF